MKKLFVFFPVMLLAITILAGVLRLYKLDKYPAGFHIDEASLGYNGYSIFKTGKDEHGNTLPLYIDMFGDNRPSGYHYLTIIPIAIFGLNEFATRLPGALFGTMSVIALFYLVYALCKDKKIALLSSFLLAITPWHIVSSRASAESIVALFFILSGMAFVIGALSTQKIRYLLFGSISLILSFFFYHTPRVFVPLLLLSVVALIWGKRKIYTVIFQRTGIILFIAIACMSLLLVFVIKGGTGRFGQVSIFGSPETKLVMEEQLREDGVRNAPPTISRIFHNKFVNYSLTFVTNYFDYFTGKFLFISGGRPLWYKVPNMGMLYIAELPFIIVGFIYLCVQRNTLLKLPLVWLFIAPIVASITTDDIPNIQRVLVMFPMFEILASYGLVQTVSVITRKKMPVVIIILGLGFLFNVTYFLHQYYIHGASHETEYRFNGFKEMVLAVKDVYQKYDHIIITKTSGGIYPHVLFFMKYDPGTYQKEGSPKDVDFGGFGKFIFVPSFCPSVNGDDRFENCLHTTCSLL
ncbi:MAG: glycosyltransferase family 39 protein [Candidatus Gottesmanbacteria bacterium]|nr:glycosyltransferase family 39 protein [Candidatus Gottesmanbacteria bacterium]